MLPKFFNVLVVWLATLAFGPIYPLLVEASTNIKTSIARGDSPNVWTSINNSNSAALINSSIRPTPSGMNFTCDGTDVDEKHFFQFNAENFYCSNVVEWYANWTIQKQTDPEWKAGEGKLGGEWKLFAADFTDDYNFDCSAARASCMDVATRWELQRIHPGPGNREKVRRIFFVFHLYSLMHDYENSMEKAFEQTHFRLIGLFKDLINRFTPQEDPHQKRSCQVYHAMLNTVINMCVSMATNVVSSALDPWTKEGRIIAWMQPTMYTIKAKPNNVANAVGDVVSNAESAAVKGAVSGVASNTESAALKGVISGSVNNAESSAVKDAVGGVVSNVENAAVRGKANSAASTAKDAKKKDEEVPLTGVLGLFLGVAVQDFSTAGAMIQDKIISDRLNINGGMGLGTLCAAGGGDFQADNEGNIKKLEEGLADKFAVIRVRLREMFSHLYHGHVDVPGEPSLMAKVMHTKAWFGPGSVTDFIEDTLPMEKYVERSMVIDIMSRLLSESYNYMKCAHNHDAVQKCEAAKHAKKHRNALFKGQWHTDKQYWCPKPEEDPTLVCSVIKYYFAKERQHEKDFIGWDQLESFAGGRYNLSWPELFQESWENYEKYRNDFSTHLEGFFLANGHFSQGFFLPTCVNELVKFADYNTLLSLGHNRWNFPGMCGNFRANETAAFMDLMNTGVKSDLHKNKHALAFWRDRIPRALRDNITPFSHYMALCAQGIHWPLKSEKEHGNMVEWWHVKWWGDSAADKECAMISEATKGMNEIDANYWFCVDGRHTVFDRERLFVQTTDVPQDILLNHRDMCTAWKEDTLLSPKEADEWFKSEAKKLKESETAKEKIKGEPQGEDSTVEEAPEEDEDQDDEQDDEQDEEK